MIICKENKMYGQWTITSMLQNLDSVSETLSLPRQFCMWSSSLLCLASAIDRGWEYAIESWEPSEARWVQEGEGGM